MAIQEFICKILRVAVSSRPLEAPVAFVTNRLLVPSRRTSSLPQLVDRLELDEGWELQQKGQVYLGQIMRQNL